MANRMAETGRLETGSDHRHPKRERVRQVPAPRPEDGFYNPNHLAIPGPNEYHSTGSIRSFRRLADMSIPRQRGGP